MTPHELAGTASRPPAAADATFTAHTASAPDPAATGDHASAKSGADRALGTVVAGKYTLLEVIGEGGMGTVYLADQTEPVRRQVALKVIKVGTDSRNVLARFEAERQALALMDHPNIARVFDAGTAPDGRPFFVMELVQGAPLTAFCDAQRLSVRERLGVFVTVCQAVQHAHQKGVIHRDLKPSNILVADVDGKPVPKVIDFGLAKALQAGVIPDVSLEATSRGVVGTPLYMAPEQADPDAADIDTRADVYALGAVLYELLTGSPPLEPAAVRKAALAEVFRLIQEAEPPTPTRRLASSRRLNEVAAARRTDPSGLGRLVRGDLEWIALRCLEKDRARRYETANGLAADVQRYLADEPVSAGPPSRWYRVRKFVKRNSGAVLAASLVLLALIAGIVGTTVAMLRAMRAEEEEAREHFKALQQADHARRNLRTALDAVRTTYQRVADTELISVPEAGPLRFHLARTALEYNEKFLNEMPDDPSVRWDVVDMYRVMAALYEGANEPEQSLDFYNRALKMARKLLEDQKGKPQADGYRMNVIKTCWRSALMLRNWGRYDEALPYLDEAQGPDLLGLLRGRKVQNPMEGTAYERQEAFILYERARHELDAGHFAEALDVLDRPLKFFRAQVDVVPDAGGTWLWAHNTSNPEKDVQYVGWTLYCRGITLQGLGRRAEAEATFAEGVKLYQEWEKLPPPGAARGDRELAPGVRRYELGPDQDARHLLAEMLLRRGLLLSDDPGRAGQAEADFDQSVGLLERLARDFDFRASFRRDLVAALNARGRLWSSGGVPQRSKAEADFRAARQSADKLVTGVGGNKPALADLRNLGDAEAGLGRLALARGDRAEAEAALRRAATRYEEALAVWPRHAECRRELEQTKADLGRLGR